MGTLSTVTRYIKQVAGILTEQAPIKDSAGAGDADKIPCLDATGKLDATFMPVGIVADVKIMPTSENLSAGNFVNVYSNAGVLTARKADATAAGKACHGYVLAATVSPANATVYFEGTNTQTSGQTIGADVFLLTTAGTAGSACPAAAGNVAQAVGKALSATEIAFEPGPPITIA